jgi:hypothetical protein
MSVRIRRMKNFGKGVRLPEGTSSSEEDIEMSPPTKSMVDELGSYSDPPTSFIHK